ncbi:hypothetical protein QJS10_CPB15g01992 [Acorus calamus]|uniref:Uncharacterized protein n=1 Tax=Acorus calamus TaxID=4465 RepID=A0AAV9D874_ACOCL|nr:hypothetical protein QJS10_CPB15g01992 [Acorus calamus]
MRILTTLLVIAIVVMCIQPRQARVLIGDGGEDRKPMMRGGVAIQSLPRGPVPPSGPSGCTNVPGNSDGPPCGIPLRHL